jgi:hypothetical protein
VKRHVVGAVVLGALLAACTATPEPGPPPASTTRQAAADDGLRPVDLPYRDGIGSVWPETAAQAICQALSAEQWGAALGGPVRRSVTGEAPLGVRCEIATEAVTLTLHMSDRAIDRMTDRIAGHPARIVVHNPGALAEASVELVPGAQRPVLAAAIDGDSATLDDVLRRAVTEVVPTLLPDGPATPVPDFAGRLAYPPAAAVPAVPLQDLPAGAQALALCAALAGQTDPAPVAKDVQATVDDGAATCQWRVPEFVWATLVPGTTETGTEIAGRPAQVAEGKVTVALGGQGLLILQRSADAAALRAWAGQVVGGLVVG